MTQARDWPARWLRDAHAVEEQAGTMLSAQAERIDNRPGQARRIRRHMQEIRLQADRLRACRDGMGKGTSAPKGMGGKPMAAARAIGGFFAGDEVKDPLVSRTSGRMEIAPCTMRIAAAGHPGKTKVARVCQRNLQKKIAMAEWLNSHPPGTACAFLDHAAAGDLSTRH